MRITIQERILNKTFHLDLDPTQDKFIHDIKLKIQAQEGFTPGQQTLFYAGDQLEESCSLIEANIVQDGTTLHLLLHPDKDMIQVQVKLLSGSSFTVKVKATETVASLKSKIAFQSNVSVTRQRLMFGGQDLLEKKKNNDKESEEEDATLADYKIEHQSIVRLRVLRVLYIQPAPDPDDQIKNKNMKSSSGCYKHNHNNIKHKRFSILVESSDTILLVKQKIMDHIQDDDNYYFPGGSDTLRLNFKGSPLDDDKKTVSEFAIESGSLLELVVPLNDQILTLVQYDASEGLLPLPSPSTSSSSSSSSSLTSTFAVNVKPSNLIRQVKQQIVEFLNSRDSRLSEKGTINSISRFCLTFGSYQLQDHWTVADCNLESHSIVLLSLRAQGLIRITVETITGKAFSLEIPALDTLDNLKRIIAEKEEVPKERQRLVYCGRLLLEGTRTLADYQIKDGSVVRLRIGMQIVVHVASGTGETITLDAEPTDSISKIKQMIMEKEGIPREMQSLSLLDDEVESSDEDHFLTDDVLSLNEGSFVMDDYDDYDEDASTLL